MARQKIEITKEQLLEAINRTVSARQAAFILDLRYTTFIRHCKEHGIYAPNQGGRGTEKPRPKQRIPVEDVLSNRHYMPSHQVKKKLLSEGLKKNECEVCGQGPTWNGQPLVLQLDHVDGNKRNNALENLRMVCPNCHTQTETFSGRNRTKRNASVV